MFKKKKKIIQFVFLKNNKYIYIDLLFYFLMYQILEKNIYYLYQIKLNKSPELYLNRENYNKV